MTLLVITPDYASHALPLLTLAGEWLRAGERVVVASGPAVAPRVAQAGMEHVPLSLGRGSNDGIARPQGQAPAEASSLRGFFAATRRGMVATLRYQAEQRAVDLLWQPLETARRTLAVVEAIKPDTVVVDHLAFGATIGLRAAAVDHVDVVLGHPRQLPVGEELYGVPGAWPSAFVPDRGELADLHGLARSVSRSFTSAYNEALLELSSSASPVADAFTAHGDLVLYNYPGSLHDSRRAAGLPVAHAFLGGLARDEELAPEVARWLERDVTRPLVLVSLGTFLSAREDVLAIVAKGLRGLGVRVALASGSARPEMLGELPTDWLVAPFLPQIGLLRHASALVTHAGNNSVIEAISAGVPMLALPFSTDQFDGAAAIERAGLGLALDPNRLSGADIAESVGQLIDRRWPVLGWLSGEMVANPGPRLARRAIIGADGGSHAGRASLRSPVYALLG